MIYLIEPYNAYAPKGKKKHWTEIYEEEALFQRMIAEAAAKNQNPTMPPNTPSTVNASGIGTAAGAGGIPVQGYFKRDANLNAAFTLVSSSGAAPSTASITNASTYAGIGTLTYKWLYGTSSLTSTLASPATQGYTAPGTYTVKLEVTESTYQTAKTTSTSFTIT